MTMLIKHTVLSFVNTTYSKAFSVITELPYFILVVTFFDQKPDTVELYKLFH